MKITEVPLALLVGWDATIDGEIPPCPLCGTPWDEDRDLTDDDMPALGVRDQGPLCISCRDGAPSFMQHLAKVMHHVAQIGLCLTDESAPNWPMFAANTQMAVQQTLDRYVPLKRPQWMDATD